MADGEKIPAKLTGEDIRDLRESLGMDQRSLAKFLGMSRQTINAAEKGHSRPGRHLRIAVALLRREIAQQGDLSRWPTDY